MAKRVVEHHFKAAEHHELAALHHKEAARLCEAGEPDAAAHQAQIAQGHPEHAVNHAAEAAKATIEPTVLAKSAADSRAHVIPQPDGLSAATDTLAAFPRRLGSAQTKCAIRRDGISSPQSVRQNPARTRIDRIDRGVN